MGEGWKIRSEIKISDLMRKPIIIGVTSPFFLDNHQKPWGNFWFLKTIKAEKNGESTSRIIPP